MEQVHIWLPHALDCKFSGQVSTPGQGRDGDFFSSPNTFADLTVPVLPSCAQQTFKIIVNDKDPINLLIRDGLTVHGFKKKNDKNIGNTQQ